MNRASDFLPFMATGASVAVDRTKDKVIEP